MKRTFICVALCALTLPGSAQFKIYSNGNIAFNTDATPLSPISLNCNGEYSSFLTYRGEKKGASFTTTNSSLCADFHLKHPASAGYYYGLVADARPLDSEVGISNGTAIAIWGSTTGKQRNVGVFGSISAKYSDGQTGAGIVGSTSNWPPIVDSVYAGYFYGDVKVTKKLVVNGSIQGLLLGASSNSATPTSQLQSTANVGQTKDLLSQLNVSTFHYATTPISSRAPKSFAGRNLANQGEKDGQERMEEAEEEISVIEQQNMAKNHYALNADQLEEMFPDLVYEREDGSKVINYVEMIPLLVQSISELNAEVARLKGENGAVMMAPATDMNALDRATTDVRQASVTAATLRQNTPNPFTERTTIGFTLPDDAKNAYIYIFDMQGKMMKQMPIDPTMQGVTINGYELQPGLYLYSLFINGQEIDTKRMILSK